MAARKKPATAARRSATNGSGRSAGAKGAGAKSAGAKRAGGGSAGAKRAGGKGSGGKRKWSADVMKRSDALDLKAGIFKLRSAHRIAQSLKKSAEASHRRKAGPFQSAMSMLNFEINRAGKGLSDTRRRVLEQAKVELRKVFDRPPA